jgi:hypothetical protein
MVLPTGTYLVRIRKFERKTAKSGNDMIQWQAVVVDGPHMGATISDFTSLTDSAVWKAAKMIKCCGVDIAGQLDTDGAKFWAAVQACVGNTVYWQVKETVNDKGNPSNKVETYASDPNQVKVGVNEPVDDVPDFAR